MNDIEIIGLDDLIRDFAKLGEEAVEKLRPATIECAKIIQARAKAKVHNVSGNLQKNIKVSKPSKNAKDKYAIHAKVTIGKKAWYAAKVELGHRLVYFGKRTLKNVPPQPFLRPAAEESKQETTKIITDEMNKILEEWGD